MTRLHHVVTVAQPLDEAFAFIADLSHLPEWDPGIVRAERLDSGSLGTGSEFEVAAGFFGREVGLRYEIVTFDAPSRVVYEGRGSMVKAVDDIELRAVDGGTEVDYTADLTLTGPLRLAQPLFSPIARRLGARAMEGLQERLGEL